MWISLISSPLHAHNYAFTEAEMSVQYSHCYVPNKVVISNGDENV